MPGVAYPVDLVWHFAHAIDLPWRECPGRKLLQLQRKAQSHGVAASKHCKILQASAADMFASQILAHPAYP